MKLHSGDHLLCVTESWVLYSFSFGVPLFLERLSLALVLSTSLDIAGVGTTSSIVLLPQLTVR
jgi:hypothetical protein